MTPEQLRAHNMLTHTLWLEWEEYCQSGGDIHSGSKWVGAVQQAFGCVGRWTALGYAMSDYEVAGEHYTWMPID